MPDPLASLKEATLTAVGFAVLGLQRAQVHRRQVARDLDALGAQLRRCASSASPRQ